MNQFKSNFWRRCACLAACFVLTSTTAAVAGTDFSLQTRPPGPGHRFQSYWWHFNRGYWELVPPDGFSLMGGETLRLWKTDATSALALCRSTTPEEAALLASGDEKARAEYVRSLLPSGVTNVVLVGQEQNPLPVNGLSNFLVSYTYDLGGLSCRFTALVSQGGEPDEQNPPVPGQPAPAPTPKPTPGPDGKPVRSGELFTAILATPEASYGMILGAFEQLMAEAKVLPKPPGGDVSLQYSSHGMLNR